jgi:Tol biopolymer transport system component
MPRAALSPDELTIYLARGIWHVWFDIYVSTRPEAGADFGVPTLVPQASTPSYDIGASLPADGLSMFLDSYWDPNDDAGHRHVQLSTRPTVNDPFTTPTVVQEINSPPGGGEDGTPYVLPSGNVIYFTSSRSGRFHIYRAERGAGGTFGTPVFVDGLPDPAKPDAYDAYPVVTDDERTIYFASARVKGGYSTDIFVAHRADRSVPFDAPTVAQELSSAASGNDPTWLSPDGCRLYLVSNRSSDAGTSGSLDVWVAERTP